MDVSAAKLLLSVTELCVVIESLPTDPTRNSAVTVTIRGAERRAVITLIGSNAAGSPAHPFSGDDFPYYGRDAARR